MSFWIVCFDKKRSLQTETPRFIKLVENGWDANALIHTNHHKSKCPTTNRNLVRWPQAWIDIYWTRTDLRQRKCPKLIQAAYKLRIPLCILCILCEPEGNIGKFNDIPSHRISQVPRGKAEIHGGRKRAHSKMLIQCWYNVDTMLILLLVNLDPVKYCKGMMIMMCQTEGCSFSNGQLCL